LNLVLTCADFIFTSASAGMIFRVQTCGSGEELTLNIVPRQETVLHIKNYVRVKWGLPAQDQALVCCGHVLEDDMLLASLSEKNPDSETIWCTVCKLPLAENEMHRIGALKSIFSLSADYEPSDSQDSGECISIFLKFCQYYSSASSATASVQNQAVQGKWVGAQAFAHRTRFTWRPTDSEQSSLRYAAE
jgi:hypothetical protein